MKLPRRKFLHLAAGAAVLRGALGFAWAQAYPVRPVRVILQTAPGGTADVVARLIGQWLSERLGQPFVVENRPGASGNIGTEAVVRATPDGYTLLIVASNNAINASLYDKLNFNFLRDIAPVAGIMRTPMVMEVNTASPIKSVPEFIAYAKANPGKMNFASGGVGIRDPSRRRVVRGDDRSAHGSRALSRPSSGTDRSPRRPGASRVRSGFFVACTHPSGRASALGCDRVNTLRGLAGCPDRRRLRTGL